MINWEVHTYLKVTKKLMITSWTHGNTTIMSNLQLLICSKINLSEQVTGISHWGWMVDTTLSKEKISSYDPIEAIASLTDDLDSLNQPKYCLQGSNYTFTGGSGLVGVWVARWVAVRVAGLSGNKTNLSPAKLKLSWSWAGTELGKNKLGKQ